MIVSNINLPNKVHNKDFHYSRLMIGFVYNNDNLSLLISIYDLNLEPLLFPHLFSDGKGHYHDMKKYAQSNENKLEILGKYAKYMILLNDSRFRLDYYWLTYTYLQLEKLRHYQNTQRILRKKNIDESHKLPLIIELIQQSNYSNTYHINLYQFLLLLELEIPIFIKKNYT